MSDKTASLTEATLPNQASNNGTFADMKLDAKLLRAVEALGYTEPTAIQKQVIPIILEGKDLMGGAETGSGKTAAFTLPVLQKLLDEAPLNPKGWGPRVIILTPTRELADQISETVRQLAKYTQLTWGSITGGVPYPAQERLLRRPLDVLVATPGRIIDHMDRGRVDFSRLQFFILDEADRMLDIGFIKGIETIFEQMPLTRQILLFSATFEGPVQRISKRFLQNPEYVQLASTNKPNALITQHIHQADDLNHKRALLTHVLQEPGMWLAIVFTGTKRGAEKLADDLNEQRIECAALHGDMKQSKRTRTLDRMRRGQLRVLIATDVAARGLDVKNISHVINFDMPNTVDDYIHRIGRTGRAGEAGVAISLVEPKDWYQITNIERSTGSKLERKVITGLEPRQNEPRSNGGNAGKSVRRFSSSSKGSSPRGSSRRVSSNSSSNSPRGRSPSRGRDSSSDGGYPSRNRAEGRGPFNRERADTAFSRDNSSAARQPSSSAARQPSSRGAFTSNNRSFSSNEGGRDTSSGYATRRSNHSSDRIEDKPAASKGNVTYKKRRNTQENSSSSNGNFKGTTFSRPRKPVGRKKTGSENF